MGGCGGGESAGADGLSDAAIKIDRGCMEGFHATRMEAEKAEMTPKA